MVTSSSFFSLRPKIWYRPQYTRAYTSRKMAVVMGSNWAAALEYTWVVPEKPPMVSARS